MIKYLIVLLLTSVVLIAAENTGKFDNITTNTPSKTTIDLKKNVDIQSTGGVYLPSGTTVQRPAPSKEGLFRYNNQTKTAELYADGAWGPVGGGLSLWITAKAYKIGDIVIESNKIYRCLADHTSGTFATDLGNGNWAELSDTETVDLATGVTGTLPITNGGTGSATQNFVDLTTAQTVAGAKTFSSNIVGSITGNASTVTTNANLTGDVTSVGNATTYNNVVPVNKGGTGSATQNFVDLSTTQVVSANKTFSTTGATTGTIVTHNGSGDALFVDQQGAGVALNVNGNSQFVGNAVVTGTTTLNTGLTGPIKAASGVLSASAINLASEVSGILPIANGGTGSSSKNFVDLTTSQTVAGLKQFSDSVGIGGAANANAVLDVQSTTKAFLPPRMTTAQMNAIASPVEGMTVYNTDFDATASYNGTTWVYGFGYLNLDNTYSAKVSSGGVVSGENRDWISGNCTVASPSVCNFVSGIFTVAPNCTVSPGNGNRVFTVAGVSTASVSLQEFLGSSNGSISLDQDYVVSCQKQGADYLSASSNAYATSNADTDWQSYTPASFQGFGTATDVEFFWRKQGPNIQIRGAFSSGTVDSSEARISLPTGFTSADTTKIPSLTSVGIATTRWTDVASTTNVTATLIEPSVTYMTFQRYANSILTKAGGSQIHSSSSKMTLFAEFPIQGWANSPFIVGSFQGYNSTPGMNNPKFYSATVSNTGVVSKEKGEFITGDCTNTNPTVCTLTGFTSEPNCWPVAGNVRVVSYSAQGTTSVSIDQYNDAGAPSRSNFVLACHGE